MVVSTSTWAHPPLSEFQMPKQLRVFCFTSGIPGSNVFPVEIDDNQTIGELKKKIK